MNDMQNLGMDSKALEEKINTLQGLNSTIASVFTEVKNTIQSLQGEWESLTSEAVFQNFQEVYKVFDSINAERQNDLKFLTTTKEHYESMEQSIDSLVDSNIHFDY